MLLIGSNSPTEAAIYITLLGCLIITFISSWISYTMGKKQGIWIGTNTILSIEKKHRKQTINSDANVDNVYELLDRACHYLKPRSEYETIYAFLMHIKGTLLQSPYTQLKLSKEEYRYLDQLRDYLIDFNNHIAKQFPHSIPLKNYVTLLSFINEDIRWKHRSYDGQAFQQHPYQGDWEVPAHKFSKEQLDNLELKEQTLNAMEGILDLQDKLIESTKNKKGN